MGGGLGAPDNRETGTGVVRLFSSSAKCAKRKWRDEQILSRSGEELLVIGHGGNYVESVRELGR